jgi:hypothetical protein
MSENCAQKASVCCISVIIRRAVIRRISGLAHRGRISETPQPSVVFGLATSTLLGFIHTFWREEMPMARANIPRAENEEARRRQRN